MIIEIPKGYVFTKKENIIAFEENGILKMYARNLRFEDLMYDTISSSLTLSIFSFKSISTSE